MAKKEELMTYIQCGHEIEDLHDVECPTCRKSPPTLQQLIDDWGAARIHRLAEAKKVEALEVEEKKLKAKVIAAMIDAKQTSTGGQRYGANYSRKEKPTAGDWSKIYAFIKENDAFDLLQKRLTEKAVELRWEDGITIPGVVKFPVDDITMFTV